MGFHNWITVTIGAFLNAMILGSIFTWGNLSVYVVAYLRNEDSPSVTEDDSYVVYTIMVSIFTLSEPLGSKLMVTIGGKWNMLIGCGLALCGIFFSALAKNIYVISITVRYK